MLTHIYIDPIGRQAMKNIFFLLVVFTIAADVYGRAVIEAGQGHRQTKRYEQCVRSCHEKRSSCKRECYDSGDDVKCLKCESDHQYCTGEKRDIIFKDFKLEDENPEACKRLLTMAYETPQEAQKREFRYYF